MIATCCQNYCWSLRSDSSVTHPRHICWRIAEGGLILLWSVDVWMNALFSVHKSFPLCSVNNRKRRKEENKLETWRARLTVTASRCSTYPFSCFSLVIISPIIRLSSRGIVFIESYPRPNNQASRFTTSSIRFFFSHHDVTHLPVVI